MGLCSLPLSCPETREEPLCKVMQFYTGLLRGTGLAALRAPGEESPVPQDPDSCTENSAGSSLALQLLSLRPFASPERPRLVG